MRLHRKSALTAALAASLLAALASLVSGCADRIHGPAIQFTLIPVSSPGGPIQTDSIAGRVIGLQPGQRLVLYAHANDWYVQPTTANPFTPIQPDGSWKTTTHLGSDYAALLVDPGYRPPDQMAALPPVGHGVVVVAIRQGRARVVAAIAWRILNLPYDSWWFRTGALLSAALVAVSLYRLRVYRLTRQLNARFEERLAERTRIAQELHDTLLQGFLSASMQVDVAADRLPEDSPARPLLRRALQLMAEVTEEGRNVIRGLRIPGDSRNTLEEVFSNLGRDLALGNPVDFRVVSHLDARPLRPAIRDEIYRIGREALANAFKHAHAASIEAEIDYGGNNFRLLVRDDGCGIDPTLLDAGRQNHWGLPGMRQRAEAIGATLRLRSRSGAGSEIELIVPGSIAFVASSRPRSLWRRWLSRETADRRDNQNSGRPLL
jgi:signal transduction histidine kinase